ncbi:predicted protein [Arabidopsis lyrata subsp. lyrata]|uniref:ADP-ribosyl cyclase/cyclic ADP-ribose hydrolase n=1 Tax=Arabidopsis lyrata subsp. lyrata TaxID=81972 RepID=D7LM60_ARALL|nr:predicted protein [Arabidopsis lyrata subsp. lyrata]
MAHSSSSCTWVYDVFPSFSGEDVRVTFLSHFLKELDRKLIIAFKDNEIKKSESLDPVLKQAIKDSRIAVVVFSINYASSTWCLNELVEIVKCKEEFSQMVIPVFYRLDPSHVRKQTGDFGKIFEKTCHNKTEEVKIQWKEALTSVANILGYHSTTWFNEAKMIEEIANDVLDKLLLTTSRDFEDFVGIEDHISEMSILLQLASKEVRMVGIWGSSGIGKTIIARALFNRLSRHFHGSIFIDRAFISKSMNIYSQANSDDYNLKLHMQGKFLSQILDKKDIKVYHLGAMRERLKNRKVLICIDDLDDQLVLDALVGQTHWFGCGSRIIVITKDKHFLRAHKIDHIYEVRLPSEEAALEMLCRSTFKQKYPPDGFLELASEVALRAGNLPLGLNILSSYLRGRDKKEWMDMLPRLRNGLDGKIEKTLRVSYDGLNNKKDKAIFRHIACLFNREKINDIKLLLANSDLDVTIGLKNLVDKSLIHESYDIVEMHSLLQEMGKEIVRMQSNEPGEHEFLVDWKDTCDVLEDNKGTKNVLGISLDIDEIDEVHIHENAFKGMRNLFFLKFFTKRQKKEIRWHLSKGFDHFPPKLRLLSWEKYPLRCMPSNFHPENLVKLVMRWSKLEKLWDGVHPLTGLKEINLWGSKNLIEIPDLSMATNLEKLVLNDCSSLMEIPSSIQYLNELYDFHMERCENLEILPTGINLQSLYDLNLMGCSRLKSFPDISSNISTLDLYGTTIEELPSNLHLENLVNLRMCEMRSGKLWEREQPLTPLLKMVSPSLTRIYLSNIPTLVELPSSIHNLHKLEELSIWNCKNLETLPTGINLKSLYSLDLSGCSQLRCFPDISTNISELFLNETAIEEVPWWIENFINLSFINCGELSEVILNNSPTSVTNNTHLPVCIKFINCFKVDQEALLMEQSGFFEFSCDEVPSYFTHQTIGASLINVPLLHISPCQPFFIFRACALVDSESIFIDSPSKFQVCCRFIDSLGNHFDPPNQHHVFSAYKKASHMVIFECCFPLNDDNAPLAELNYDHVDIQFHLTHKNCQLKLKGCGIRFFEDDESSDGNETEYNEECPYSDDKYFGSEKWEDCDDSDLSSEIEQWKDCEVSDLGYETDHSS